MSLIFRQDPHEFARKSVLIKSVLYVILLFVAVLVCQKMGPAEKKNIMINYQALIV